MREGSKRYEEAPRTLCGYEPCGISAVVKIGTHNGGSPWLNLCMRHYEQHFKKQARETCEDLGLVTLKQKRAYVKEKLAGIFRMREPGEDLDETTT